jgi:hypothetical protein
MAENAVSKSGLPPYRPYDIFEPPLLIAAIGTLTNKDFLGSPIRPKAARFSFDAT